MCYEMKKNLWGKWIILICSWSSIELFKLNDFFSILQIEKHKNNDQ